MEEEENAQRTVHETAEEKDGTAAAAEVARSGDLYQSQRTPVTMATKLDFFFEVFSALLAGAHSPEKGVGGGSGGGGGEGGSTEETASGVGAREGRDRGGRTMKEGSEGEKRTVREEERTSIEKVGETLTNGDRGSQ